MKRITIIAAAVITLLAGAAAHAYMLPDYRISDGERSLSVEQALGASGRRLDEIAMSVNVQRLFLHQRDPKVRLARNERRNADEFERIDAAIGFWRRTADLKRDLVALCAERERAAAAEEADAIARSVMETLYRVSSEWRVGGSALFRNLMINMGTGKKGFCWHYVEEMWKALPKREWRHFDIRWGTAWEDDFRENNALVVTAKGRPFEEGLAIDPWRTAGRPFWTKIEGDRFPWKEGFDYDAGQ